MENNGRDVRGLFQPGNTLAKGNPGNRRMAELRRTLLDCATDADIRALYDSLMESARGGDTAAARVLLEYLIGKPAQQIEVSGPDGQALGLTEVVAVVMEALGGDTEARIRVAAAFKRMGRIEADGDGLG